jgi:hypothetical protein
VLLSTFVRFAIDTITTITDGIKSGCARVKSSIIVMAATMLSVAVIAAVLVVNNKSMSAFMVRHSNRQIQSTVATLDGGSIPPTSSSTFFTQWFGTGSNLFSEFPPYCG